MPGDKLLWYASFMMVISAGLPLVQILLAIKCFPECRMRFAYWRDWKRLRSLFAYAGWVSFGGGGGSLIGHQGSTLVTNHYFGTAINASYGIAGTLANHTQTLSNSLMGALSPAVTTREGSGDRQGTLRLANRTGKFGAFLILLFAVPMALEMKTLLLLWLGRIPDHVVLICVMGLAGAVIEKFTLGFQMAIAATGRIALWQFTGGILNVLIFPFAWLFAAVGIGPVSAAMAILMCPWCTFWTNLFFAKRILGADVLDYLRHGVMPVVLLVVLSAGTGSISLAMFHPTWWRVLITTALCLSVLCYFGWGLVLSQEERHFISGKVRNLLHK